jgi:polygalacturonase
VRDFGAKGEGKVDDTRAIGAAIAAAPGGTVWFPPGIYVVSKTLTLKAGSTYRGSNPNSSVIKQANGANLTAVMADERCHVYHSAQNAMYLSHTECTYVYCNEIDHFGLTKLVCR